MAMLMGCVLGTGTASTTAIFVGSVATTGVSVWWIDLKIANPTPAASSTDAAIASRAGFNQRPILYDCAGISSRATAPEIRAANWSQSTAGTGAASSTP